MDQMQLNFYKYEGAGNDFVMIDNRTMFFDGSDSKLIEHLCDRRFGIGADGLILLQEADGYDFRMVYFNSDGFEASMCGNGARCVVAFARQLGIIGQSANFMAADGPHRAVCTADGEVDLLLSDVEKIDVFEDGYLTNTGVPHFVTFVENLELVDVNTEGRKLRFDPRFQPNGANVNFVSQENNQLIVYTYERGVECETLACGTGVTASALCAAFRSGIKSGQFFITAKGGRLSVRFKSSNNRFTDVWLKGPARKVFDGKIDLNN